MDDRLDFSKRRYGKETSNSKLSIACEEPSAHYAVSRAIVVTNSSFTSVAITLAEENEVIPIDHIELIELLSHQARRDPNVTGIHAVVKAACRWDSPFSEIHFGRSYCCSSFCSDVLPRDNE